MDLGTPPLLQLKLLFKQSEGNTDIAIIARTWNISDMKRLARMCWFQIILSNQQQA